MKTSMDCRTLGESKTNYTNSTVRQMKQSDLSASNETGGSHTARSSYNDDWERDALGYSAKPGKVGKSTTYTTKRKSVTGGQIAAGLLAGASVGVLAGILLAPEKGKDLRKKAGSKLSLPFKR